MSGPGAGDAVAVVTGAARGIGRGIALALARTGATVYVTDRQTRAYPHPQLPGTVEDTAEQVTGRGGRGVPVGLDHTDDAAVAALFERVRAEQGRLDLLVANAFDGNALPFHPAPFWELPLAPWRNMFDNGVRTHLVAARYAAPLLVGQGRGMVVLTGYTDPEAEVLAGHLYYDLAMHATSRLARTLAAELRPHGVTALAVSPGFTRTEAILAALADAVPPGTDSVEFVGQVVRALWQDPDAGRYAGATVPVATLAAEYRVEDPEPRP